MSRTIEKVMKHTLPVIPLRGIVPFPTLPMSFEIQRDISVKACEAATQTDMKVLLVAQKDVLPETITADDLYKVGCIAIIKNVIKTPAESLMVMAQPMCRCSVSSVRECNGYFSADVIEKTVISDDSVSDVRVEASMREAIVRLEEIMQYMPSPSQDFLRQAKAIKRAGELADFIAYNFFVRYEDKQEILDCLDPYERIELLTYLAESELELIKAQEGIHRKVRGQIDEHRREAYLREQLKIIQDELGMGSEDEASELMERIEAIELPEVVEAKLKKEAARLFRIPQGSPESTSIISYLETCLDIPWDKKTTDRLNLPMAERILNDDHEGLEKIKERILEYLAVKQLSPGLKNMIICFVGPPGVGKTSLGRSIARAMNRNYARISFGGVRDEADIRGHRKTYIASMPGRIINALIEAKSMNPVIQLDEIDKLCRDAHGDPASALLEVLDSEQNSAFRDHYIELPVDLSECLFIASANTLDTIPAPLLDRMEIIELSSYLPREKLAIAKNHLMPKQLSRHGLTKTSLKVSDEAIEELISGYTREAGVRSLEREIASLCRKSAKYMIDHGTKTITVSKERLPELMGPRRFRDDDMYKEDQVAVVNGLAYTEFGGDLLKIEVNVMEGTGKLELTGQLGDVMKESARIAVSYVRAHAAELHCDAGFYKNKDIHIHVPEGAVPKDGPSAGVTMVTAITSALSGRAVRCDTAMTGEVTLTGRVLPIGGLREKTTAAYIMGVKRVIIPTGNTPDLEKLDPFIRSSLEFIPCRNASEVLEAALAPRYETKKREKKPLADYPDIAYGSTSGWISTTAEK